MFKEPTYLETKAYEDQRERDASGETLSDQMEKVFEARAEWLSNYGMEEMDVKFDGNGKEYIFGEENDSFDGYEVVYLPEHLAFLH